MLSQETDVNMLSLILTLNKLIKLSLSTLAVQKINSSQIIVKLAFCCYR